MKGSSGLNSGGSSVATEVAAEKGNGLDDARYRSPERKIPVLSSTHRGTSPNITRPGVMYSHDDDMDYDRYDDRDGGEDWANTSKLVV
jgi:hypothetical protein